jgi:hypothetical protein
VAQYFESSTSVRKVYISTGDSSKNGKQGVGRKNYPVDRNEQGRQVVQDGTLEVEIHEYLFNFVVANYRSDILRGMPCVTSY